MSNTSFSNPAGTYDFSRRDDKTIELERLMKQAGLGLDHELKLWFDTGLRDGQRALDLACGPGLLSCAMAKAIPRGEVVGVDINSELLNQAKQIKENLSIPNLTFQEGSAYAIGFPDESFDYVYARFLFQHLEDPLLVLKEIKRVLKPGGKICVMDIDDGFLALHPEPARYAEFARAGAEAQKSRRGNRMIGRELFSHLAQSGFVKPRTLVHVVTTHDWGKKTFIDVTTRFKAQQIRASDLATPDLKLEECLAGLDSFVDDPTSWGAVGIFMGVAER